MLLKVNLRVPVALFAVIFGATGTSAFAQSAAGCFIAPAKLADADIASFTTKPDSLLSTFPMAGMQMATQVRGLAGSSSSTLEGLIALINASTSLQKTALGAGLGRAAKACQAATPDYAQLIQQKVAGANDSDVTAAFLTAVNDVQTASIGGAAGGGGGAAGLSGGGALTGSTGTDVTNDAPVAQRTATYTIGTRSALSTTIRETDVISPF